MIKPAVCAVMACAVAMEIAPNSHRALVLGEGCVVREGGCEGVGRVQVQDELRCFYGFQRGLVDRICGEGTLTI